MPRVLHYSDLENAYDTPERVARVAACLRERDGDDALVAGSGDNTGPGVLSLVTRGRQALDFFETVGPDVETVGNHDLDHGPEPLLEVAAASPQPWVLANVRRDGAPFGDGREIERERLVDVAGTTVGVTGVVDERTPDMTPGLDELSFGAPVAAAERAVARLTERGADATVVLAHTGTDTARALARIDGVDAVLAGHKHDTLVETVAGTPISRPGATGRFVFELELASGEVTRHRPERFDPDPAVRDALDARIAAHELDEEVARVDEPLDRSRESRTGGEWRLGNFVADAYRWASGADVGLQNSGGIREGPPLDGRVTRADLVGVSPFEEPVVVVEVTGADLQAVAHEADGRRVPDIPDYWWGHVSGMTIARNGDGFDVTVDGTPLDPDGVYTVAAPRYLLVTEREFPTLEPGMCVAELDLQYEVIVEYANRHGVDPELEGRVPRI